MCLRSFQPLTEEVVAGIIAEVPVRSHFGLGLDVSAVTLSLHEPQPTRQTHIVQTVSGRSATRVGMNGGNFCGWISWW